jgi:hypothetical protein
MDEESGTGWFVAVVVVLAFMAIGYLVFGASTEQLPLNLMH